MKNMDEKFILSLPKEVLPGEQETKLAGADLEIRAFFFYHSFHWIRKDIVSYIPAPKVPEPLIAAGRNMPVPPTNNSNITVLQIVVEGRFNVDLANCAYALAQGPLDNRTPDPCRWLNN